MIQRLKFRGKVASRCIYSPSAITRAMALLTEGEWFIAESPYVLAQFFTLIDRGKIDPPTVSQWTGLKDSKGVDVYEGDIVRIVSEMEDAAGEQVVKWHDEGGYFAEIFDGGDYVPMLGADDYTVTVIGNVHDKEQV